MAWYVFAGRLIVAFVLGGFVGAERQWRQRTAGLRTNAERGGIFHLWQSCHEVAQKSSKIVSLGA